MSVDVLAELEDAGAIYTDKHFVYTSGKHGSAYINLDPLFPNVRLTSELCELMIEPFFGRVDTVAAPATGGIVLGVLSARSFNNHGQPVASVWADKSDGEFVFERAGFLEHITGKRVLVVEDLLNSGVSVERVCRLVEKHGGEIVGASVVCNRGPSTKESLGVPQLEALATVKMEIVPADECTLCANGVPIVEDIGHGSDYKADHPDYTGGYVTLLS